MKMLKIKKHKFSTMSILKGDNKKIISDEALEAKLDSLEQEREYLENDLHLIKNAIRVASKATTGETATNEEKESFQELKDNYPSFFDSDEENEQQGVSILTKIATIKRYIKNEMAVNNKSIRDLLRQTEHNSLSNLDVPSDTKVNDSEKKSNSSEESSKILSQDSCDDTVYNPFDDIGTD